MKRSKVWQGFALLMLVAFVCFQCPGPGAPNIDPAFSIACAIDRGAVYSETTYTDMGDGTIKTVASTWSPGGLPFCPTGGPYRRESIVYTKKCLQGQVYQVGPNDCRGAGNVGDNWSAQTFRYCATNDRSCEVTWSQGGTSGYKADPSSSASALSCNSDTTAGRSWQLLGRLYYGFPFPGDVRPLWPEIPLGPVNLIWYDGSDFATYMNVIYFDASGARDGTTADRTTLKMVMCVSPAI